MKYMRSVGVYKHIWVQKGNAGPKNQAQMAFIREGLLWGHLWVRLKREWLSGSQSRGKISPRIGENSTLSCSPKTSTGTVLGKIELPHSCCQASGLSLFIPRSQSHRAAGELRPAVEHGSFSSAEGPRGPGKGAGGLQPWSWQGDSGTGAGRSCVHPHRVPLCAGICAIEWGELMGSHLGKGVFLSAQHTSHPMHTLLPFPTVLSKR